MVSKRCIAGLFASAALGVDGARLSRNGSKGGSKVVAGVPILNYGLAYGGHAAQKDAKEHWVVVAKSGATTDKLKELCTSAKVCERVGHPSNGGMPFFEIYSTESELEKVLAMSPGDIDFVEPDGMFHLDPKEDEAEASSAASWGLDRIDAPNRYATGAGAHIYVLDTGVRWTHNDFGDRAEPALDMTSGELELCSPGSSTCAADVRGHGTHCAGTAAGRTFGVAPGALVYGIKVLSDTGSGSWSWSYSSLDWLSRDAAKPAIASMSLGGSGTQQAMRAAVDAAVAAGVTVVVAAGNSNSDACFFSPAFVPSAITVGSTDSADRRSGFSNYGSCVEIWAPGSRIVSADVAGDDQSSTKSGTSMACPHVSGAAALVLGENSGFTPAQVMADLADRAELGAISDLRVEDNNILLWVGSGAAPSPAPTPAPPPPPMCPDFAANREPDSDGDCLCANNKLCSRNFPNRDCPTSGAIGGFGGRYFLPTCLDCRCYSTLS